MIRQLTVREFYHQCYKPLRLAGAAETTREAYLLALKHLADHVGRDPFIRELGDEMVAGCLAKMVTAGRSPATANKTRAHLLAIWRFARRRGLIDTLPEVDRLREPKRIPKAWTEAEVTRILQAAAKETGEVCAIPSRQWWVALLLLLYDTGLRISAAMHLRWRDLDEENGIIFVPAEVQKQNADQVPFLSEDMLPVLRMIRREHAMMFPWPFDRGCRQWPTLTRHLRRILKRAGLPSDRKDLFHKFRKTTASYIKLGGGDPTEQLGHSSPAVTRAYLDPRIVGQRRMVDLLPRPELPAMD